MSDDGNGGLSDDNSRGLKGDRLLGFFRNLGKIEFQIEIEK